MSGSPPPAKAQARERIWAPLAQWLTGNALARLSAATFVHVLSLVFLREASDAKLTYHSGTINQRLLTPLKEVLRGDTVQFIPLQNRRTSDLDKRGYKTFDSPTAQPCKPAGTSAPSHIRPSSACFPNGFLLAMPTLPI